MGFWDGLLDVCNEVGNHFSNAFSDVGSLFSEAGKNFSDGKVGEGLANGALGVLDGIGNVITLGFAHKAGEAVSDVVQDNVVYEEVELQDGAVVSVPRLTDYPGGGLAGGIASWVINTKPLADAEATIVIDKYEEGKAKAEKEREKALEAGDDEAVKQLDIKISNYDKWIADAQWKRVGNDIIAPATPIIGAQVLNKTLGMTAPAGMKTFGVYGTGNGFWANFAAFGKSLGAVAATGVVENQLSDGKLIQSETGKSYLESFCLDGTAKTIENIERSTKIALGGGTGINRLFNTIGAGLYAASTAISKTTPGLFVAAVCKKAGNGIKTWATGQTTATTGLSIQDVMDMEQRTINEKNLSDKSITDIYVNEVVRRDKLDKINFTTRSTVQKHVDLLDDTEAQKLVNSRLAEENSEEVAEPAIS